MVQMATFQESEFVLQCWACQQLSVQNLLHVSCIATHMRNAERTCMQDSYEGTAHKDHFCVLITSPICTYPPPQIPVVLYHGTANEREDLRRNMFANTRVGRYYSRSKKKRSPEEEPFLPVVVTSYEICMRDQRFLENRSWKFLVVDEGHRIKNLNCKLIR